MLLIVVVDREAVMVPVSRNNTVVIALKTMKSMIFMDYKKFTIIRVGNELFDIINRYN